MKKLMLSILCIGAVFAGKYPDAIAEGKWTEEEIVSTDYEDEWLSFYFHDRINQLFRKAEFLHSNCQFDESCKCYEEAGYLALKLSEDETAYNHISPDLIAGLCFENSSSVCCCLDNNTNKNCQLAKQCYKVTYESILWYVSKIESPPDDYFELFIIRHNLKQAALAAYLYGDQEAFAQLLYKQMDLCCSFVFTHLIFYMEELQLLAHEKFPTDHWIISKMKTQMEQKILKEIEHECRIDSIKHHNFGAFISLFHPENRRDIKRVIEYFD